MKSVMVEQLDAYVASCRCSCTLTGSLRIDSHRHPYANDIINKMDRDLAEGHHLRSVSCLGTKSFKTMLHIVSHCLFPPSGPLEAQDDVHWASWPETVVRAAGGACQVGSCYGRRGAIKEREEA